MLLGMEIAGVVLILALGWIIFRMATLDVSVDLVFEYKLPEIPEISFDKDGGRIAVAVNDKIIETDKMESVVRPIASTAKIITALAVLEKKPLNLGEAGETLEITGEDYNTYLWYVAHNGSITKVEVGEKISEYDALSAMLMASSNNMADTLASWAYGSFEEYKKAASEMLEKWGLTKTKIGADASGYDSSTVSTAEEMAVLGQKVLENPVLKEIVGKKTANIPVAGEIENSNKTLGQKGIAGIKTGYNGNASGYCLISGYFEEKNIVTATVLGAVTRQQSFDETLELVGYLQEHLKEREIVPEGEEVGHYDTWWTGKQPIVTQENLAIMAWKEDSNRASLQMNGEIGEMRYLMNGKDYTVKVKALDYSNQPTILERFLRLFGWEK